MKAISIFLTYLTLLPFFLLAPAAVWGQEIEWIRQFGGSDPYFLVHDSATAVDANGDVYVAGSTNGTLPGQTRTTGGINAFICKYDANGNEIWTRQFGDTAGNDNWAHGVAADSSGVYVVGMTTGSLPGNSLNGRNDAFIRKYDINGNELWTRQFGGWRSDIAHGVATDFSGSVYVVGQTDVISTTLGFAVPDAFIRKYDSNGNELWTRQLGSPSIASGVDADSSGVYMVGHGFIRKYDFNGNELWTRQFGGRGRGVAVDALDIYIVGETYSATPLPGQTSSGGSDAFIRKYEANGNEIWTRQFGTSDDDAASGISVDSTGVYLAGQTYGAFPGQSNLGYNDAFVRMYDANGNEFWTRQFGTSGGDLASGISVDLIGMYVAGSTSGTFPGQTNSGSMDAFVAKFTSGSSLASPSPATVNSPPVVDAGGPYSVNEGGAVLVTTSGSDPDGDPITFAWDLDNNGSFETPGQSATFSAAGLDGPSSLTITARVTDSRGLSTTDQATVNEQNVAPTVGAITNSESQWVNVAMVSVNFTDPGIHDTHTAVWDWGDNSTSPGSVSETNGSGSVSDNHIYAAPGAYTITLTVTDKDGSSGQSTFQFVVPSDPTGGGWINSPPGAYTIKPSLTGRANFGFVSRPQKSHKGAITPNGHVEFNFPAADLNFRSLSYEQPTVSGPKAQFKGLGSINGAGNYIFLMTIIDGQLAGGGGTDKLRIKIWDQVTGNIVYDNQMGAPNDANPTQEIAGGNIVIQDSFPAAPTLLSQLSRPLAVMLPKATSLGAAFPNPFNPETWIPYDLAKEVKVIIRIYNVSGNLIRSLDLGHKVAGFYTSKDKAAYWDGRNDYGERVSSGIYFYTIQAGEFRAIRRILLLK